MRTFCHSFLTLATISILIAYSARAQVYSPQLSVSAEASIQEQPPRITLSWLADDSATSYTVYRYDTVQEFWGDPIPVGNLLTWTDTDVTKGVPYEYKIEKNTKVAGFAVQGFGYVYTGIDVPAQESRGTVILVVDDTFANALASELSRYISDLRMDGWKVIRHNVKRSDSVGYVKSLIYKDMVSDTFARTLFLFGHVPVPYSGFMNPDGHPQHYGAWPADVYYGDTITEWTDEMKDTFSSASHDVPAANINVPHDGKFDPSNSSEVDLQIGRVDFWNMPSFSLTEEQLLKQYLDKDHAFRVGTLTAPKRAIISDNFPGYNEGFASSAWRTYANLVGGQNINAIGSGQWFSILDTAPYLWAYGCGGGWFQGAGGIGTTTNFATQGSNAIFNMLFGSFFGDWNDSDNFLRAPLCTSYGLTNCWAGRPQWYVHRMSMGATIGSATQISENATVGDLYEEPSGYSYVEGVHMDLMGDPTLRMEYDHPPSNFHSIVALPTNLNQFVSLSWQIDSAAFGFNIYRAHRAGDQYVKLNSFPVAAMNYIDSLPNLDSNYYEIRAVVKSGDSHGTYFTAGLPSSPVSAANLADVASNPVQQCKLSVRQTNSLLEISVAEQNTSSVNLSIVDMAGRELALIADGTLTPGVYNYQFNISSLPAGAYFVRLASEGNVETAKVAVIR